MVVTKACAGRAPAPAALSHINREATGSAPVLWLRRILRLIRRSVPHSVGVARTPLRTSFPAIVPASLVVASDSEHQSQTYEPKYHDTSHERPEPPSSSCWIVPEHREPPVQPLTSRFRALSPDPPSAEYPF